MSGMKNIFWVVLVIGVVVVAYLAFKPEAVAPVSEEVPENNAVTVEGEVTAVNTEQVSFDGPALVTVATENGEATVAVPSMGINLCAAKDAIADVFELSAGDRVTVRGSMDEEGRIVPCEDASHYLRVEEGEEAE